MPFGKQAAKSAPTNKDTGGKPSVKAPQTNAQKSRQQQVGDLLAQSAARMLQTTKGSPIDLKGLVEWQRDHKGFAGLDRLESLDAFRAKMAKSSIGQVDELATEFFASFAEYRTPSEYELDTLRKKGNDQLTYILLCRALSARLAVDLAQMNSTSTGADLRLVGACLEQTMGLWTTQNEIVEQLLSAVGYAPAPMEATEKTATALATTVAPDVTDPASSVPTILDTTGAVLADTVPAIATQADPEAEQRKRRETAHENLLVLLTDAIIPAAPDLCEPLLNSWEAESTGEYKTAFQTTEVLERLNNRLYGKPEENICRNLGIILTGKQDSSLVRDPYADRRQPNLARYSAKAAAGDHLESWLLPLCPDAAAKQLEQHLTLEDGGNFVLEAKRINDQLSAVLAEAQTLVQEQGESEQYRALGVAKDESHRQTVAQQMTARLAEEGKVFGSELKAADRLAGQAASQDLEEAFAAVAQRYRMATDYLRQEVTGHPDKELLQLAQDSLMGDPEILEAGLTADSPEAFHGLIADILEDTAHNIRQLRLLWNRQMVMQLGDEGFIKLLGEYGGMVTQPSFSRLKELFPVVCKKLMKSNLFTSRNNAQLHLAYKNVFGEGDDYFYAIRRLLGERVNTLAGTGAGLSFIEYSTAQVKGKTEVSASRFVMKDWLKELKAQTVENEKKCKAFAEAAHKQLATMDDQAFARLMARVKLKLTDLMLQKDDGTALEVAFQQLLLEEQNTDEAEKETITENVAEAQLFKLLGNNVAQLSDEDKELISKQLTLHMERTVGPQSITGIRVQREAAAKAGQLLLPHLSSWLAFKPSVKVDGKQQMAQRTRLLSMIFAGQMTSFDVVAKQIGEQMTKVQLLEEHQALVTGISANSAGLAGAGYSLLHDRETNLVNTDGTAATRRLLRLRQGEEYRQSAGADAPPSMLEFMRAAALLYNAVEKKYNARGKAGDTGWQKQLAGTLKGTKGEKERTTIQRYQQEVQELILANQDKLHPKLVDYYREKVQADDKGTKKITDYYNELFSDSAGAATRYKTMLNDIGYKGAVAKKAAIALDTPGYLFSYGLEDYRLPLQERMGKQFAGAHIDSYNNALWEHSATLAKAEASLVASDLRVEVEGQALSQAELFKRLGGITLSASSGEAIQSSILDPIKENGELIAQGARRLNEALSDLSVWKDGILAPLLPYILRSPKDYRVLVSGDTQELEDYYREQVEQHYLPCAERLKKVCYDSPFLMSQTLITLVPPSHSINAAALAAKKSEDYIHLGSRILTGTAQIRKDELSAVASILQSTQIKGSDESIGGRISRFSEGHRRLHQKLQQAGSPDGMIELLRGEREYQGQQGIMLFFSTLLLNREYSDDLMQKSMEEDKARLLALNTRLLNNYLELLQDERYCEHCMVTGADGSRHFSADSEAPLRRSFANSIIDAETPDQLKGRIPAIIAAIDAQAVQETAQVLVSKSIMGKRYEAADRMQSKLEKGKKAIEQVKRRGDAAQYLEQRGINGREGVDALKVSFDPAATDRERMDAVAQLEKKLDIKKRAKHYAPLVRGLQELCPGCAKQSYGAAADLLAYYAMSKQQEDGVPETPAQAQAVVPAGQKTKAEKEIESRKEKNKQEQALHWAGLQQVDSADVVRKIDKIYKKLPGLLLKQGIPEAQAEVALNQFLSTGGSQLISKSGDELEDALQGLTLQFKSFYDAMLGLEAVRSVAARYPDTLREYYDRFGAYLYLFEGGVEARQLEEMEREQASFASFCRARHLVEQAVELWASRYVGDPDNPPIGRGLPHTIKTTLLLLLRGELAQEGSLPDDSEIRQRLEEMLNDSATCTVLGNGGQALSSQGRNSASWEELDSYAGVNREHFITFLLKNYPKAAKQYYELDPRSRLVLASILSCRSLLRDNRSVATAGTELRAELLGADSRESQAAQNLLNFSNGENQLDPLTDYSIPVSMLSSRRKSWLGETKEDAVQVESSVWKRAVSIFAEFSALRSTRVSTHESLLDDHAEEVLELVGKSQAFKEASTTLSGQDRLALVNGVQDSKTFLEFLVQLQQRTDTEASNFRQIIRSIYKKVVANQNSLSLFAAVLQKRSLLDLSHQVQEGFVQQLVGTVQGVKNMDMRRVNDDGHQQLVANLAGNRAEFVGAAMAAGEDFWRRAALALISYQVVDRSELQRLEELDVAKHIVGRSRSTTVDLDLLEHAYQAVVKIEKEEARLAQYRNTADNITDPKARELFETYKEDGSTPPAQQFQNLLATELKKEQSNENKNTYYGIRLLGQGELSLLLAAVSDRQALDIEQKGRLADALGGTIRDFVGSDRRMELAVEYVRRGRVRTAGDPYKTAVLSLCTRQYQANDNSQSVLDWKLLARALELVFMARMARRNRQDRVNLERVTTRNQDGSDYEEDLEFFFANRRRAGNRLTQATGRVAKSAALDLLPDAVRDNVARVAVLVGNSADLADSVRGGDLLSEDTSKALEKQEEERRDNLQMLKEGDQKEVFSHGQKTLFDMMKTGITQMGAYISDPENSSDILGGLGSVVQLPMNEQQTSIAAPAVEVVQAGAEIFASGSKLYKMSKQEQRTKQESEAYKPQLAQQSQQKGFDTQSIADAAGREQEMLTMAMRAGKNNEKMKIADSVVSIVATITSSVVDFGTGFGGKLLETLVSSAFGILSNTIQEIMQYVRESKSVAEFIHLEQFDSMLAETMGRDPEMGRELANTYKQDGDKRNFLLGVMGMHGNKSLAATYVAKEAAYALKFSASPSCGIPYLRNMAILILAILGAKLSRGEVMNTNQEIYEMIMHT